MDLNFKVTNQKIEKTDKDYMVNMAHNYHIVFIDFTTNDWDDKTIFVILKNNSEAYRFPYDAGGIVLPGAIVENRQFRISAYGVDNQQNRITTDELRVYLHRAGFTTDIVEVPEEEFDIIADIYTRLDTKVGFTDVEDELDIYSTKPVQNKVVTASLNDKSDTGHTHNTTDITDFPSLSNVATSGDYRDLNHKPTIESLDGDVTVQQVSATSGYFASYQIMQGGEPVGSKIDIPKDYLVKSATLKTIDGQKYIDFVINTKDGTGSDEHLLLNVQDLMNVYDADNNTLVLTNGVFSIKNKGVGTSQLSDGVNTSLGYANTFNSSPCKNITSSDITNWNGKQTVENLVTAFGTNPSDSKYPSEKLVKDTIDAYIGDINDYIGE
jgi:hypothetical protein